MRASFDLPVAFYNPLGMGEAAARWVDDHSFEVRLDGNPSRVSVTSDAHLHRTGDALLAFCLPIAMATGSRLVIEDEVDEGLMRSQTRIQELLSLQFGDVRPVSVDAPTVRRQPRPGISSFFSGGVDSTYTVLRHRAELTQLVFIHGFDTLAAKAALRAEISQQLGRAADTLGIPFVEIYTDVRDLSDRLVRWIVYYPGALAGVAHMLDTGVCLLSSSHPYGVGYETTVRPLLDPLWTSGAVMVEHDGADATRAGKIAAIARDRQALGWLRVCYKNPDQAYNCGTCEKCVRTMLPLKALGVLEQAATFPNDIDLGAVRRLRFRNRASLTFARDNLRVLEGPLRRALRTAYQASAGRRAVAHMLDGLQSGSPSWAKPSIRLMRSKARALRSGWIHS